MGQENIRHNLTEQFTERMSGGAFAYRAAEGHELLFANQNMVRLFECANYEEFAEYVGNSFDGIVDEAQLGAVQKEIELQVDSAQNRSGHIIFNIRTKNGNVRLIEDHWTYVSDPEEGDIFYVFVVSREFEITGTDLDSVTGLYGKNEFSSYVSGMIRRAEGRELTDYAILYINLVNFKLLNINRGVAEGDNCLLAVAEVLRENFRDSFIARLGDDHFAIFAKYDGVFPRIEETEKQFMDNYGIRSNVSGKCGIYRLVPNPDMDVESAISLAKVACDYIKYDSKKSIVEYSEELAEEITTREYVLRKVDEAIANDWIKLFFQPVIRSLTGELCGMESLVRWDDPEIGFLLPGKFIEILETEREITKLDCYVVDKVCRCIRERTDAGLPMVPVSVNFSRLDFIMKDMLAVVEEAVKKYDIPRDYIHIEITESMIASDEGLMRDVISSFRKAGYEIWMDDFGSGYSSLTLLKDYQFDMLKMDMRFLSPFTEKSRDIMRSAITMAQDIGIRTLAEGVETLEQVEFLKSVGCGRLQGYYYGRPEPIEDMFLHMQEKGVLVETRKWRHFYDVASFQVRVTDTPLEVLEDDGTTFRTLFMNEAFLEQCGYEKMSLAEIDERLYHRDPQLLAQYREFANVVERTGKLETFYYTYNGNYICLRVQALAQCGDSYIIRGAVFNLTKDPKAVETERLDSKLREINQLYDEVHLFNIPEDRITSLLGTFKYINKEVTESRDIREVEERFINTILFPTEKTKFMRFVDIQTIRERVENSENGYITEVFRLKQPNGNYQRKEISIMMVSGTEGAEYLYCVRPYQTTVIGVEPENTAVLRQTGVQDPDAPRRMEYAKLWENVIWNSQLKCFWKDKKRRFRGVSQAFLDYYGMDSVEEVLGKTDEEMHWHINDIPYQTDEWEVLLRGRRVQNVPGQCIVRGVVRDILCSKMPIYENGEIVGLMGFFVDREEEMKRIRATVDSTELDSVTGLMNAHSFVETMIDYAIHYNDRKTGYGLIALRNETHDRIVATYGEIFANRVLKRIGEEITTVTGQSAAVSRTKESIFAILSYFKSEDEMKELAARLEERLDGINLVDGNSVTLRIRLADTYRTDDGVTDENIYERTLQKIQ